MDRRHPQPLTGIVLCGGAGRRVGGVDKPLLLWRGSPMVHSVVERLRPQVDTLLISANRNGRRYAAYGRVIADRWPGHEGPLAGVASVLAADRPRKLAAAHWYLLCPGDVPTLPLDLGQRLLPNPEPRAEQSLPAPRYIHDGERAQPLFALLKAGHLPALLDYLQAGERSVISWLTAMRAQEVRYGDPACFRNRNRSPDDND